MGLGRPTARVRHSVLFLPLAEVHGALGEGSFELLNAPNVSGIRPASCLKCEEHAHVEPKVMKSYEIQVGPLQVVISPYVSCP